MYIIKTNEKKILSSKKVGKIYIFCVGVLAEVGQGGEAAEARQGEGPAGTAQAGNQTMQTKVLAK